jgi:hypothetical protein
MRDKQLLRGSKIQNYWAVKITVIPVKTRLKVDAFCKIKIGIHFEFNNYIKEL